LGEGTEEADAVVRDDVVEEFVVLRLNMGEELDPS